MLDSVCRKPYDISLLLRRKIKGNVRTLGVGVIVVQEEALSPESLAIGRIAVANRLSKGGGIVPGDVHCARKDLE